MTIPGEDLDGNLEGFIDDAAVEEEGEGSGDDEGKRKHEESDLDEDLEDDDFDLIKDNLGIDIKKKVSAVFMCGLKLGAILIHVIMALY